MQYNPLSHIDRIERTNLLANRIIANALQSERGDIIRVMNVADLKMMKESVVNAVYNKLAVEAQRAYDYNFDKYVMERDQVVIVPAPKFELIPDAEIEKEVSAFFEIDGKLQYREVKIELIGDLDW